MAAKTLTQAVSTNSVSGTVCRPAATPSKRAFLQSAAAAAAAATIPAGAALASEPNPDAAFLALQPEIDAADQAWEARYRERTACEKVYFAVRRDKPKAPMLDKATGESVLSPEAAKAVDAYADAEKAWRKATGQAHDDTGLTASEEAQTAADAVRLAICNEKIIPMRAKTLEGLIFKARYAASHFPGDPDEDVMRSIVDDLLAMAGEVV